MPKPKTVMLIAKEMEQRCFTEPDLNRIACVTNLTRAPADTCTDEYQQTQIAGTEIVITGWGTRPITAAMLDAAPGLQLLCHSAGSLKSLIDTDLFMKRGIRVSSARSALAVGVAEFAFGMMLVSMKAVWHLTAQTACGVWDRGPALESMREPYGATVGIIGASAVGREMIRLCKTLALDAILVYDPYVTEEEVRRLGAVRVDLDELMQRSDAVSLHTPITEETRHLINARNLALMKDRAIFINTARGSCVDEAALIAELRKGRLWACLDVTDPEPPVPDSPLYSLPNCILTPHVAGAVKENTWRQGKLVADQIEAYVAGQAIPGEIDLIQHERLA